MAITDTGTHALLIDGEDVVTARTRTVVNPADGEPIAEVADGTAQDAERAVAAAKASYRRGDWSRITPGERAAVLDKLADLLEERADEFARVESLNTGKPLKFSSAFDLPLSIDNLRYFASAARNLEGKASGEYLEGYTSTIRREPIGVCASIAPWNYPLNMAAWKVGPALAAGNAVVLKPSELTPLTALMLGHLALEAGLPPGILNVVPGPGAEAGAALARNPDVRLISVTGSTRTIGLVTVKINQYGPAQTMLGLENAARAAGYSVSISILDDATAEAMRDAVDRFVWSRPDVEVLSMDRRWLE